MAERVFRANPQAFVGGDMDRLVAGAVLDLGHLPDERIPDERNRVTASPAREPASSDPTPIPPPADQTEDVQPPIPTETPQAASPEPTQPHQSPSAPAAEGLHILNPEEPGPPGAVSQATEDPAAAQALALARELAESRRQEAEALKHQITQLQRLVERQENLITLQAEQLAALQERLQHASERNATPAPPPGPASWLLWWTLGLSTMTLLLASGLGALYLRNARRSGPPTPPSD